MVYYNLICLVIKQDYENDKYEQSSIDDENKSDGECSESETEEQGLKKGSRIKIAFTVINNKYYLSYYSTFKTFEKFETSRKHSI